MFRDGQYLEVIKASENCLGAAIVTVQEKTIEMKNKKVSTNKWLTLEDWAAVYKILKRALLQNNKSKEGQKKVESCECTKSTRQLQITYTFENSENVGDILSLPTLKVIILPVSKRTVKTEVHDNIVNTVKDETFRKLKSKSNFMCAKDALKSDENQSNLNQSHWRDFEEYIPNTLQLDNVCHLKYVPSKKSTLQEMQLPIDEYTPATSNDKSIVHNNIHYIPNTVKTLTSAESTYKPCALTMMSLNYSQEYIPNSRNITFSTEEYEPDFKCKSMKFDDSYVPSNLQAHSKSLKKFMDKLENKNTCDSILNTCKPKKKSISGVLKSKKRKL